MNRKVFCVCLLLCADAAVTGCATTRSHIKVPTVALKDLCDQNGILVQWDNVSQVVTLKSKTAKANVLLGSNVVLIGSEKIMLSVPVKIARSSIVVPEDFKANVIDRLKTVKQTRLEPAAIKARVKEIIIDPGHGGKDPGAIGRSGLKEKKVVLDIARRLKKILESNGLKVKMTRETDEFISLEERTETASRSKADLFVSVHANSHPSRSVSGLEVYSLREQTGKEKNDEQRLDNIKTHMKNFSMDKNNPDIETIVCDMLYMNKRIESDTLASDVARKTPQLIKTKSLGSKHAHFFVLRNTLIPAILVEVGFLTNPKEERLLNTFAYRQKIANALARNILDYVQNE